MKLHPSVTNWHTTNAFNKSLQKFNKAHNNKYDYSLAVYLNSKEPIEIVCPIHGSFWQMPSVHLRGSGCTDCCVDKTKSNSYEFITKALNVHGNLYTYNKVVYVNSTTKVIITCPVHGDFEQTPSDHLKGKHCFKCNGTPKKSTAIFIADAKKVHGELYVYDSSQPYHNNSTKFKIVCTKCQNTFYQGYNKHVLRGDGCSVCSSKQTGLSLRITNQEFISKAKEIHGDLYGYHFVNYVTRDTPVKIYCHGCNEIFSIAPNKHTNRKQGCRSCSSSGFKPNRPGLLYYFKITDGTHTAWKIGITNLSIRERYSGEEFRKMSDFISIHCSNGQEAYDEEQRVLEENKQHKYNGPRLLVHGNTELFSIDIFNSKE